MAGPPFRTERLLLRDFVADDWSAVHEYDAHPEVVRFMTWGPNSEQDSRDFVQRNIDASLADPRTGYELAVVEQDGGRLVGGAGLTVTPQHARGFLGYCFHRDDWGRGYATEASRELLRFAFEDLGLHRVSTTCDTENHASARVLAKLGMQQEGVLRQDMRLRTGQFRDHFVFALLADEWRT
jgi:ribosomal-protein-alanine N-acetyltransferase